jgi:3-hydroxyacyl-[acyl-carrier-protein] dehydratase
MYGPRRFVDLCTLGLRAGMQLEARMTQVDSGKQGDLSNAGKSLLIDLHGIDLGQTMFDRAGIARVIPHRHEMALFDAVVWHTADFKVGIARWKVKADEFWVRGHFPDKAMLPGVLQVEAGAQLSAFLFNSRYDRPRLAAFTHIHEASFRNPVQPGDDFFILCKETRSTDRRFTSNLQGLVNGKVTFEASISGMALS